MVEEAVTGVRVVKGFGQEERELAAPRPAARGALRLPACAPSACRPGTSPLCRPFPSSARSWCWLSGDGWPSTTSITLGTFLAFSTYLLQLAAPARMLAGVLIVASRPGPAPSGCSTCWTPTPIVSRGPDAEELPPVAGEITFEGVRFGYLSSRAGAGRLRPPRRRRGDGRPGRRIGIGQVDRGPAAASLLRCAGRVRYASTGSTSATSPSTRCGARSAWCSRRASCSPTPSGPTSPMAGPTPATPRWRRRPAPPRPTASSRTCPTATTPWSANAASPCRAASASASPWPGRCSPTRGS